MGAATVLTFYVDERDHDRTDMTIGEYAVEIPDDPDEAPTIRYRIDRRDMWSPPVNCSTRKVIS